MTIRPGVASDDVHGALKAVRTAIGALWLVYVIEPSGNGNTHAHVVAALDGGSRSHPAPDEATDLDALALTIATTWTLAPESEYDLMAPHLLREAFYVDTLPAAGFGTQTRRTATGYFLTYMLKNWHNPETHQEHARLLGGQDRAFRLIGISQTRVDVEAGLTLPPITSTAPVRDGLQARKTYVRNRKGSSPEHADQARAGKRAWLRERRQQGFGAS
ncbi:MAG: hypothetical protein WKF57_10575 [Nakamurella sp.]